MQVVVNKLLVSYGAQGSGKTVVLLHGWGDRLQTFDAITKELSKHYKVIRVDLPGFGASEAPPSAWGLKDYAVFVQAFMEKVGASEPYAIAGHSNGGAIAIYGMAHKIFTTEKLILLASAGIRTAGSGKKRALKLLARTGKVVTLPLPNTARESLRRKMYSSLDSDMLFAEHMQETFKKIVATDIQPEASKLDTPTLLIYGAKDTETPIAYGQQFHELIHNSRFELIAGCGHMLHHEAPDLVSELMLEFLR